MANLDTTEANRLLDLSLPTTASAVTIKLTSTAPTASAAGTELTGGAYAAQTCTTAAAASGSKSLPTADVLFPVASADWSTILGIELWVSGVRRWWKALSVAEQRSVKTGDQYRVAASALTATES